MTVKLKETRIVPTSSRQLKAGTVGEVLATRNLTGEPEMLVKFKGFKWPVSVYAYQVDITN